ncbi:MAG: hypothetical protein U0793_25855 [Gemmataceae bacterium]
MATSRFSVNGFSANGTGSEHLRVVSEKGLEDAVGQGAGHAKPQASGGAAGGVASGVEPERARAASAAAGLEYRERFSRTGTAAPGNPYNRRVALLKRALLDAVTPEDVQEIGKRLVAEARDGDVAAARVLFTYVLPKHVEPDRLDINEWDGYREESKIFPEMMPILKSPESDWVLSMVRDMRPAVTNANIGIFADMMKEKFPKPGAAGKAKKGRGKRGKR